MNDVLITIAFVTMFFAGFISGFIIAMKTISKKVAGSIKLNDSDPEEPPYLFAEFNKDINDVLQERYIILMIDVNGFTTQK